MKKEKTKAKRSKLYFGWWTVWATGILSGMGHGFYGYGISVFFKDLAAELGLSRAITSLASGIGRLEGGITSPLTGWLADRFGPKWIIFIGVIFAGTGLILMKFITDATGYLIVWGVLIGVGLNIGLTLVVDKAINGLVCFKKRTCHRNKIQPDRRHQVLLFYPLYRF